MRLFLFGPRVWGIRPGISFRPRWPRHPGQAGAYVYLMVNDFGRTKLGFSTNPHNRRADLLTDGDLTITHVWAIKGTPVDAYEFEQALKKCARSYRVRGEWYNCSPATIAQYVPIVRRNTGLEAVAVSPRKIVWPFFASDISTGARITSGVIKVMLGALCGLGFVLVYEMAKLTWSIIP